MDVKVLKVNPFHPQVGRVVPFVVQRVIDCSRTASPEMGEITTAADVLISLASGDPATLLLAFLDEKANVVGHLLAKVTQDNAKRWVTIVQYRADQNVGDAGKEAVSQVEQWAREIGAQHVVFIATGNQSDRWKDRGFKPVRTVLLKEITPAS